VLTASTLAAAAVCVLETATEKVALTKEIAEAWRSGGITEVGSANLPARPARPIRPEVKLPRDMPKRRIGSAAGRARLLHALAHIELNAIDLAWDLVARFAGENLPREFFDDWVSVAQEEATHHQMICARLAAYGVAYGDFPAHDGLWQAAEETAHDLLARLAVVPLVLEARGLDVTPALIARMREQQDEESAAVLKQVYADEIRHVAAGRRWFEHVCRVRRLAPVAEWQRLVRRHFKGVLKPPFNDAARSAAGLGRDFYEPLARQGSQRI